MLLRDAGVRARWSGPPTAEEIVKLDQERLLHDPLLTEAPSTTRSKMARLLLAERSAEQLGAALVKLYRSRLPAIEDVVDPGVGPELREPGTPRAPAPTNPEDLRRALSRGGGVFRLDIGRKKNADPKWLLPHAVPSQGQYHEAGYRRDPHLRSRDAIRGREAVAGQSAPICVDLAASP